MQYVNSRSRDIADLTALRRHTTPWHFANMLPLLLLLLSSIIHLGWYDAAGDDMLA